MYEYITVKDAALKWNLSERRVQKLCEERRIQGAMKFGHSWMIPKSAIKPKEIRRGPKSQER